MAGREIKNTNNHSKDALFEQGLTDTTSAVFNVNKTPKRLIAFGLTNDKILIKRVLLPSGSGSRNECGAYISQSILAEQPHTVGCNPVVLCAKQPEIVIDAIGSFKVIYQGDNREEITLIALDDDVVTVEKNMRGTEACCGG